MDRAYGKCIRGEKKEKISKEKSLRKSPKKQKKWETISPPAISHILSRKAAKEERLRARTRWGVIKCCTSHYRLITSRINHHGVNFTHSNRQTLSHTHTHTGKKKKKDEGKEKKTCCQLDSLFQVNSPPSLSSASTSFTSRSRSSRSLACSFRRSFFFCFI